MPPEKETGISSVRNGITAGILSGVLYLGIVHANRPMSKQWMQGIPVYPSLDASLGNKTSLNFQLPRSLLSPHSWGIFQALIS